MTRQKDKELRSKILHPGGQFLWFQALVYAAGIMLVTQIIKCQLKLDKDIIFKIKYNYKFIRIFL